MIIVKSNIENFTYDKHHLEHHNYQPYFYDIDNNIMIVIFRYCLEQAILQNPGTKGHVHFSIDVFTYKQ